MALVAPQCPTMHNDARLFPAKVPQGEFLHMEYRSSPRWPRQANPRSYSYLENETLFGNFRPALIIPLKPCPMIATRFSLLNRGNPKDQERRAEIDRYSTASYGRCLSNTVSKRTYLFLSARICEISILSNAKT
jgi:hypothetical protein